MAVQLESISKREFLSLFKKCGIDISDNDKKDKKIIIQKMFEEFKKSPKIFDKASKQELLNMLSKIVENIIPYKGKSKGEIIDDFVKLISGDNQVEDNSKKNGGNEVLSASSEYTNVGTSSTAVAVAAAAAAAAAAAGGGETPKIEDQEEIDKKMKSILFWMKLKQYYKMLLSLKYVRGKFKMNQASQTWIQLIIIV